MDRDEASAALPSLRKAVEIQPKLLRNRQNLAACLIALGELDEAEPLLRGILAERPKFPLARFHLGLLYEKRGDDARAKSAYEEEIAEAGDSVPARFNLGELALRSGDRRAYRAQMERVVALAPERAKGYLFLARGLLAEPGELGRAQQLAERGLALADTSDLRALGYFLLADIYSRQGKPAQAAAAVAQAKRITAAGEKGKAG
jgi:predicted Zn-dependent protease